MYEPGPFEEFDEQLAEENDDPWRRVIVSEGTCAMGESLEILWTMDKISNLRKFIHFLYVSTTKRDPIGIANIRELVEKLEDSDAVWTEDQIRNLVHSVESDDLPEILENNQPATSKDVEVDFKTPTRIVEINDAGAYFSMKIVKKNGVTPMPNYMSMQDQELNDLLDTHGIRPMGRKRAIEMLTKIYEATHPIVNGAQTPTRHEVYNHIRKLDEKVEKKSKQTRKRLQPAANEQTDGQSSTTNNQPTEQEVTTTLEGMTRYILDFLRLPEKQQLYNEILCFQTFMLDRLMKEFQPVLRDNAIPKTSFLRILDHLHITYSEPRDATAGYYY
ncbi:Structure-specific endonuclease subunit SLX4 [Aphelenchoides besseyi]|nr:Structure-specific endonuclease subunit SLX4 [Aphelenchoides besseyi]KAI6192593.1 Structure-specific endonuclease subunit SLX4 [Aphelenchoides besseyi]